LAVTLGHRSQSGHVRRRLEDGSNPERFGTDNVGRGAILVEKDGERNPLNFDEGLGVALAARPDGRHPHPGLDELVVSIADLTGPLAAGDSAKVAQEEDHFGPRRPQVAEPDFDPIGVNHDVVGEGGYIKGHGRELYGASAASKKVPMALRKATRLSSQA
jgi:hypothetical protein